MLTLGSVLTAHLLPLLWYLTAGNSSVVTLTPPLLTGVFVQQPASKAAVAAAQSPAKPAPSQPTPAEPEPDRPPPTPTAVKPVSVKSAEPDSAVTKTILPAEPTTRQHERVIQAEPAPQPPGAAAPGAAAKDSAAASAVPVSAPVLNATAHYNAPPHYPRLSRKLREQGTVVLQLTVLASGKVADVTVQQSSGYARLDQAALLAVQHWRYQPAQRGGEAIDHRYRQRVEFSLTEGVN
ncbi:energy transducer TonB [Rheinheimera sp. NSM]|uniref:energy transducer TonB n=1 Tax=Rheinheimera sp. NSM TaxID=3457884 RepID=UPI004035850A